MPSHAMTAPIEDRRPPTRNGSMVRLHELLRRADARVDDDDAEPTFDDGVVFDTREGWGCK